MQTPEVWDYFSFITVSPVSKTMPGIIGAQLFVESLNGTEMSDRGNIVEGRRA